MKPPVCSRSHDLLPLATACRCSASSLLPSAVAARLLSPFAMWPAFPTSDYYGDSVPRRRHAPTMGVPRSLRTEGDAAAVPTFTDLRSTGTVPSYTPAASPRTTRSRVRVARPRSSHRFEARPREGPIGCRFLQHCASPDPPGSSWWTNRGASYTGSLALHLSVSLARPRRLAVPSCRYVVRAAPGLARISAFSLPSASRGRCGGRGRTSRSSR